MSARRSADDAATGAGGAGAAAGRPSAIALDRVTFGYDARTILDEVSLDLAPGSRTAILGPNGTGKSTLLGLMVGRLAPDAGRALIDGADAARIPERTLARRLAFIPQFHTPVYDFPVIDVVLMGRTSLFGAFGAPRRADVRVAEECLRELGIAHLRDALTTRISGGERQLVMLAAALAQEAPMIVLDEPTSHLDLGNAHRLVDLLRRLSTERGIGIVMSTHAPESALQLGGDALLLHGKRLRAHGPAADAVTGEALSAMFGVDVRLGTIDGAPACGVRPSADG